MSNIQLDYSDITDIFKEKLKIDNIVKKVCRSCMATVRSGHR